MLWEHVDRVRFPTPRQNNKKIPDTRYFLIYFVGKGVGNRTRVGTQGVTASAASISDYAA